MNGGSMTVTATVTATATATAMASTQKRLWAPLRPAPPRPLPATPPVHGSRVTFFDLPAELRIEIYRLALNNVVIHILPSTTSDSRKIPHALTQTSRQVRNEVLPMIHSLCPIRCTVTDFNFDGLLLWMSRVPPDQEAKLLKNENLKIYLTTSTSQPPRIVDSMRKWLHMRADQHRPQPKWQYNGPTPHNKICADLRRRAKRMTECGKQEELIAMLKALGVPSCENVRETSSRRQIA